MSGEASYLAQLQRQRWKLPIPLPRLDAELVSSWIVRLADAHAESVQTLAYRMIGRGRQLFGTDIDRGAWVEVLETFAGATDQPVEHLLAGTFRQYVGVLFGDLLNGPARWILPVVKVGTKRTGHGLQFCAACLAADARPYLRLHWRLAFFCWCPIHRTLLEDRCKNCGAPVAPHCVRTGRRMPWNANSIVLCDKCGADRRSAEFKVCPEPNTTSLGMQMRMAEVLQGKAPEIDDRPLHPMAFFNGLAILWTFLDDPRVSAAVALLLGMSDFHDEATTTVRYTGFERNSVSRRAGLLRMSALLLENGAQGMTDILLRAGCASDAVLRNCGKTGRQHVPFWLWEPVHLNLERTSYVPSDEEIERAIDHVRTRSEQGYANVRDVCAVLGMRTHITRRVSQAIERRAFHRGRSRRQRLALG